MTKIPARTLDFFDRQVTGQIIEKYGFDDMMAVRSFINSETYKMLLDPAAEIYAMSPRIVFDMWESEQITGDPCNSQYIRNDDVEESLNSAIDIESAQKPSKAEQG
ncbi:hypothetical protein LJC58_06565 [Lachnospiraceae bacterium OttesenSCG-928-D06]|nr:hypothetical protein [Lachnospiraceae bacterium OttesenSCG-928-D06]